MDRDETKKKRASEVTLKCKRKFGVLTCERFDRFQWRAELTGRDLGAAGATGATGSHRESQGGQHRPMAAPLSGPDGVDGHTLPEPLELTRPGDLDPARFAAG